MKKIPKVETLTGFELCVSKDCHYQLRLKIITHMSERRVQCACQWQTYGNSTGESETHRVISFGSRDAFTIKRGGKQGIFFFFFGEWDCHVVHTQRTKWRLLASVRLIKAAGWTVCCIPPWVFISDAPPQMWRAAGGSHGSVKWVWWNPGDQSQTCEITTIGPLLYLLWIKVSSCCFSICLSEANQ